MHVDARVLKSKLHASQLQRNFKIGLLCSYVDPRGIIWTNLVALGPQKDATNQISKLYTFRFQRRRILKFAVFVSMSQIVIPGAGSVLTPWAS